MPDSNLQILNKEKALELIDGDMEIYQMLIEAFLGEEFIPEKVAQFVADGKNLEGASYVHKVKGAARQLCAERLAFAGQKLEDVLRGKSEGDISSLCEEVESEYKKAIEAAKEALSQR